MSIVIRADASRRMGTGHVWRCLAVAERARERGAHTRFICRDHPGHLGALLRERGMDVRLLPPPAPAPDLAAEDHAAWLGTSEADDARETIEALEGKIPDWLIVDHYGLGLEWERLARPHAGRILVLDDLADRCHDCDVLLDANYSLDGRRRYDGLVPSACALDLGPRHALLGPQFAARRRISRSRDGRIRRVLVFFGGSDPRNTTSLALAALSDPAFRDWRVEVVVGANHPDCDGIHDQASRRPFTTVFGPQDHLADLMMTADLAIGAGGVTTWERMCLGLPAVVISIADNQRPASEALGQAGLIGYVGHVTDVTAADLGEMLSSLCDDPRRVAAMSVHGQIEVDGLGVPRLLERLFPTSTERLEIRPASLADAVTYFGWANDSAVRANAVRTEAIPWPTHEQWFASKLADRDAFLFVLEADGLPVGQIRFDRRGDEALIDYSLDPVVRGRGWGAHLVSMGASRVQQLHPLHLRAHVKTGNLASRAVFVRLGFELMSDATEAGWSFYRPFPLAART